MIILPSSRVSNVGYHRLEVIGVSKIQLQLWSSHGFNDLDRSVGTILVNTQDAILTEHC